eukprot:1181213-Prorocentrum_minimum.AAC.2
MPVTSLRFISRRLLCQSVAGSQPAHTHRPRGRSSLKRPSAGGRARTWCDIPIWSTPEPNPWTHPPPPPRSAPTLRWPHHSGQWCRTNRKGSTLARDVRKESPRELNPPESDEMA